ncbi:MAG: uL22 family ribosomal protein [archaeon]
MPNTEKPTTIAQKKQEGIIEKPKKQAVAQKSIQKKILSETKTSESKETEKLEKSEETESKEKKKTIVKRAKVKKTEVSVNISNVPISTKYSRDICKFIKYKKIDKAIDDLEQVILLKKAVPMKGEIPHRKGKIMSGRFPKRASENFIRILKSLKSNAENHDVENPVITEAIANIGERPYGKFGRVRKKRTHITIKAREKKAINKLNKKIKEKK